MADAPVVGQMAVQLAKEAGLSAILLDERYGIIRRINGAKITAAAEHMGLHVKLDGDPRRFSLPVYAAPLPDDH